MNLESFSPALREDGTFDPDSLERAGLRWVTAWVKGRLSGRDLYFPIDRRGGEDPEALVVAILRDAGTAHPATDLIARALLALLDEARACAPEIPPYLKPALRICQQVRLPQASSWFTEELKALANDPEAMESRWGEKVVREILYAASLQAPGLPQAASHASWLVLLRVPRYATLAWVGLGTSFSQRVIYLAEWWQACTPANRRAELDHFIFMGLKVEGEEGIRHILKSSLSHAPQALKTAINDACERQGITQVLTGETQNVLVFVREELNLERRKKGLMDGGTSEEKVLLRRVLSALSPYMDTALQRLGNRYHDLIVMRFGLEEFYELREPENRRAYMMALTWSNRAFYRALTKFRLLLEASVVMALENPDVNGDDRFALNLGLKIMRADLAEELFELVEAA